MSISHPVNSEELEKRRARNRASYYRHREKRIATARNYYANNKPKALESCKKYRAKNLEEIKARKREYYIENREYILNDPRKIESRKAWDSRNREKKRVHCRKSSAKNNHYKEQRVLRIIKQKKLNHPDRNDAIIRSIYRASRALTKSTGIQHSVDHIIPIKSLGWHHEDNLQIMAKALNSAKKDKAFWLAPHMGIKDWRDVPRHLWPAKLAPKYAALIEKHKGETIRWDLAA